MKPQLKRNPITGSLGAVCLGIIFGLTAYTAGAQTMYRWTDSNGVMQISDRPPPQGVAHEILPTPRSVPVAPPPQMNPTEPKPTPTAENPRETAAQTEPERDPEQCRLARENLFWLENRARVRARNEEGEMVFLTPDEAAEQQRQAEQAVALHCKN